MVSYSRYSTTVSTGWPCVIYPPGITQVVVFFLGFQLPLNFHPSANLLITYNSGRFVASLRQKHLRKLQRAPQLSPRLIHHVCQLDVPQSKRKTEKRTP